MYVKLGINIIPVDFLYYVHSTGRTLCTAVASSIPSLSKGIILQKGWYGSLCCNWRNGEIDQSHEKRRCQSSMWNTWVSTAFKLGLRLPS